MKRFAISDIHGCARTFITLLDKISFSKEDELYLLGDYIDRGPDSKGVFDQIFKLKDKGYKVQCIRGNHEEMMIQVMNNTRNVERMWWTHGGLDTLNSFNANGLEQVPEIYRNFISSLKHYILLEDYILVHAGLNFRAFNPIEDETSMLWIREWYQDINHQWLGSKIIVHGHTPIPEKKVRKHVDEVENLPVINIDNGCVYSRSNMNQLCALDLDTHELIFQKNVDF